MVPVLQQLHVAPFLHLSELVDQGWAQRSRQGSAGYGTFAGHPPLRQGRVLPACHAPRAIRNLSHYAAGWLWHSWGIVGEFITLCTPSRALFLCLQYHEPAQGRCQFWAVCMKPFRQKSGAPAPRFAHIGIGHRIPETSCHSVNSVGCVNSVLQVLPDQQHNGIVHWGLSFL